MTPMTVIPVEGIGEVVPGDDVATVILEALQASEIGVADGDVLVVTHKIVSKAEGRLAEAPADPDYRRIAEQEAATIVRRRGDLIITITQHGFICANAGVDRSNVAGDQVVLLPVDPDRSAHRIRTRIERATGTEIAVIVSDTFGRPWRRGLTDVAIGVSGMNAIDDLRGTTDSYGRVLDVTEVAVVDELAAAADLVMGKATSIPVAVVRGFEWRRGNGRATDLVRPAAEDMFR
ncbi:MAG TPA: coenzyme F420-0:L-glutamate ligase [Acidimicrobiia bacterium]|jgi:coenzyme F420-0:L-glutamate ligase/coenzyme F420-1:gamma-L-glutamate ligase|nr:coenzyme F420-0:L-glutamate ligase [Acidimicrobiia bacterium]